jgi:hypothetical protein
MAGERRTRPVTASGHEWGAATPRLEVGGGPDGRAPPIGVWREKENGQHGWPGGERRAGPRGPAACASAGEEGRQPGGGFAGCRKKEREGWVGWAAGKRGEGKKVFFFKIHFKFIFKLSNFNETKTMHSNHDAQALIIF